MWLEIFSTIVLIILCSDVYFRCGRIGKILRSLPTPCVTLPFIGNGFHYFMSEVSFWRVIMKDNKKLYPMYKVWIPTQVIVTILDPDDIQILLSSPNHIDKSIVYSFLHRWLKTGLLTSTGSKWYNRRKILTSAFHFNSLQKFVEIFMENGEGIVKEIEEEACDAEVVVEPLKLANKYSLNNICESSMGTSLEGSEQTAQQFGEAVNTIAEQLFLRFFRLYPVPDWMYYNFTPMGKKEKDAVQILHDFSRKIIQERKVYHKATGWKYLTEFRTDNTVDENLIFSPTSLKRKRLAMLDLLIAAELDGLIDDDGILEEVNTFIFTGNETTASTIDHVIQLLGENIEIQEKVREEINEVWASCDGKFSLNELNRLPLLERCIKETLRLFPTVPFIARYLKQDIQLSKQLLPKGILVHILPLAVHRNEQFWPNPDKFDPDRFLPENSVNRHPYSYIPFSAGPRNCIGQRYGMLATKTFCVHILHNFHIESVRSCVTDWTVKPDFVMRQLNPFKVKFSPINKQSNLQKL